MMPRYEFLRKVRGKGSMIGVELGPPPLKLKLSWHGIEAARNGLFCQLVTIPLFRDHKILCQVASHATHTIKLLPSLIVSDADCDWISNSFESGFADSEQVPGAVWSLGKSLIGHATRKDS